MQEVFLKVWQQPEVFAEYRGSLCGFLAVVARNRSIDRILGGRRFENIDDLQLANTVGMEDVAEREIDACKSALGMMETKAPDQRQAVKMAFFEGPSIQKSQSRPDSHWERSRHAYVPH